MKVQQFLAHHGITHNPFGHEDAQHDSIFKEHCLTATFHPAWDKILGDPAEPSTSIIFGEKGSGKTALRLQIVENLRVHNRGHPQKRVYIVQYDDFNPFLDAFAERKKLTARTPDRTLSAWKLWDHIDAMLSIAVTQLLNDILDETGAVPATEFRIPKERLRGLTRPQKRDLLLLAAYYDRGLMTPVRQRWHQLRRKLGLSTWKSYWDIGLGVAITLIVCVALIAGGDVSQFNNGWPWLVILGGWLPWLVRQATLAWRAWAIRRHVLVLDRHVNTLRRFLSRFQKPDLEGQPMPMRNRSDDRYELLTKLQLILESLGFTGITVVVDRLDEPHMINGSAERMRDFLWPMLDNKFLQHAGIGFKMLLPIEVSLYLNREDKEFYERSRLDKQNLVRSLEWSGESLYDLANERIAACGSGKGQVPKLVQLFDETMPEDELVQALGRLRVPRHLFRFLHRVLVEHCNRHSETSPVWKIRRETVHSTLALYMRDLQEFDRGLGTG